MAFLVFVVTIMLLYGGSFILAVGAAVGGAVMGGDAGIDMIYEFMMDNTNLFRV